MGGDCLQYETPPRLIQHPHSRFSALDEWHPDAGDVDDDMDDDDRRPPSPAPMDPQCHRPNFRRKPAPHPEAYWAPTPEAAQFQWRNAPADAYTPASKSVPVPWRPFYANELLRPSSNSGGWTESDWNENLNFLVILKERPELDGIGDRNKPFGRLLLEGSGGPEAGSRGCGWNVAEDFVGAAAARITDCVSASTVDEERRRCQQVNRFYPSKIHQRSLKDASKIP